MNVIFAGTPAFAATALQALHQAGFTISLVLTQPDRPAGRGLRLQASAVKQLALELGIAVAQPPSLRLDGKYANDAHAAHALIRSAQAEVMVVAAYGLLLPLSVLELPPRGCLNIHASLLPRWRGAAPIQRAIEAGDSETGITIMQMDQGLDTGAMLSVARMPIAAGCSAGQLQTALAQLGAEQIVSTLRQLDAGTLQAQAQPTTGVIYAAKITKQEAALDFRQPAVQVLRKIHAFDPAPGAFALFGDIALKFWNAELSEFALPAQTVPGTVLAANPREGVLIACADAVLRVTELQKPGGKRVAAAEFVNSMTLLPGCFASAGV